MKPERRSVRQAWESLPARRQFAFAMAGFFIALLAFHLSSFPRLGVTMKVFYSIGEAAILSLLTVFATRSEQARSSSKRDQE